MHTAILFGLRLIIGSYLCINPKCRHRSISTAQKQTISDIQVNSGKRHVPSIKLDFHPRPVRHRVSEFSAFILPIVCYAAFKGLSPDENAFAKQR